MQDHTADTIPHMLQLVELLDRNPAMQREGIASEFVQQIVPSKRRYYISSISPL